MTPRPDPTLAKANDNASHLYLALPEPLQVRFMNQSAAVPFRAEVDPSAVGRNLIANSARTGEEFGLARNLEQFYIGM